MRKLIAVIPLAAVAAIALVAIGAGAAGGQGGEYGYFQAAGSDYADSLTTPGPLPIITDPALTYTKSPDYVSGTTRLNFAGCIALR